jgi:tetratricopeptide (TPR) repeat protein
MGRLEESQSILDEIFATNPDDTYGHEELANQRYNQGRLAEAVRSYEFLHENRPGDPYAAANLAGCFALMGDFDRSQYWIDAARARGAGNRWELEARHLVATWQGDWDTVFRVGQLHLAKDGATWQGEASLGQSDWEAARASFRRMLSRLNYRQGDDADGSVYMSLLGLALAEKKLGLDTWSGHAAVVRRFVEDRREQSATIGGWPNANTSYVLAKVAAVEDDLERVVQYVEAAQASHDMQHQFFANDPFFADFREEPRLVAIAAETRERALAERRKLEPVGAPH